MSYVRVNWKLSLQWIYFIFKLGCEADHSPPSSARFRLSGAISPLPLYAFMVCPGTPLLYNLTCEQFRCKCTAVALHFHIVSTTVKAFIMSWFELFTGVQCSSVVSAQVTYDLKQNQSNLNDRSEDIKNLRCDLMELKEMRRSASRQYVREVITSDINLLSNKIESLKNDVSYKESTVTQWSEVPASRRKICSHIRHTESKPIPVIHNQYKVLNNYYISEYVNSDPVGSQPLVRNSKIK